MEAARAATEADLDQVSGLASEAVDEQRESRGGPLWSRREARAAPFHDSLHQVLHEPSAQLVVGTIDGEIVGYSVAHLETLRTDERLAVVEDIYVHAEARGVGVGEAMMDHLVAWAHQHDCIGIDALVLPGNRASKNFFETFGLKARAIVVHRSLSDER